MTMSGRGTGWSLGAGLALLVLVSPCAAQTSVPRDEVLRLVPPDAGLCLIVSNLREHTETLRGAAWLKALRASPLGQMIADSPDMAPLANLEQHLQQHLQIGLRQLRDDILGDLVVLAYRPGPPGQPQDEDGLMLLWARKADLLGQLIDRLNEAQIRDKQVKDVTAVPYLGQKYFRRSEADKAHCYYVRGSLLAFSSKEALIRRTIEQLQRRAGTTHPLVKQVERARAEQALATLWLNPRAFDAELQKKARKSLGQEAQVLQSFLTYWKALDAVVLTWNLADAVELKLSLQARAQDLPKSARRLFVDKVARASDLWARFPADAILRVAGHIDAEALAETLTELTNIADTGQRLVGAPLGLDLAKDVLPNIGPDWGICIASGSDKSDIPLMLAALAVKPGEVKVDQALYKGAQLAAGIGIWAYNSSHADSIRLETVIRDGVEIKYLTNNKAFPPGFQPAFALKDGYFLLASSPEAIRKFKRHTATSSSKDENLIAEISLSQLSKFIKVRRAKVVAGLADKNHIDSSVAEQWLDALLTGLGLFDHLLLSERREAGQVTWSIRLTR